jgi:diguanylate cyclase (GGDEF)-like protein
MVLLLAVALAGTLGVLWWVVVLRRRIRLSEERFRHMAQHDTLTGLATRLVLQDRLNVALEAAKRHHTGLAVLMLDLDRFKEVNDTFGHSAGDEVLRVTANRLLESVRKSDTVARVGGDEFVILLPEFDSANVESIAAKLVVVASGPIQFENHAVPVSVSIGVCTFSAEAMDAVEMLKGADAALYEAKEHGRRRFSIYIPRFSASQSVMGVELSSQVEGRARIAASEWIRPVRNGSDGS